MKKITRKEVSKAVNSCLMGDVVSVRQFGKGNINKMLEVKLKKGKEVLLRIFDQDWKARKEAFIYRDIKAHVDILVPEIYCLDDSKKILPNAYLIMEKMPGRNIDYNYKKYKNNNLWKGAGEILAKIHSIKFPKFGWLMDNEISPSFERWRDFVWYDIERKLTNLSKIKQIKCSIGRIEHFLNGKGYLLDTSDKPSLLHKDYHCPHILTDKNKVTGIIDVEWAIAGHNEADFLKLELWAFKNMKKARDSFFTGYLKNGHISDDYTDRKKLYELWHHISMINISYELKKKDWLEHNVKQLCKFFGK